MSSVLKTSTMKSPPLLVCVTGSLEGGMVSAAASFGPGAAALALRGVLGEIGVLAATGVVSAAAPASVAPLRKLRRPESGALLRFGMISSRGSASGLHGSAQVELNAESRLASSLRQANGSHA